MNRLPDWLSEDPCSARYFLGSRQGWFRIETVSNGRGGWDVMLRIDGTYFTDGDQEAMTKHWTQYLADVLNHEGISRKDGAR
jgi:hypothetical protein